MCQQFIGGLYFWVKKIKIKNNFPTGSTFAKKKNIQERFSDGLFFPRDLNEEEEREEIKVVPYPQPFSLPTNHLPYNP